MTTNEPAAKLFRKRLKKAIERLSKERLADLRSRFPRLSGKRRLIAKAAGMPGSSTLSDLGSSKKPGHKYRSRVAEVLGVSQEWLEGTGGEPPDWELHPIEAWRRFAVTIRRMTRYYDDSGSLTTEEQVALAMEAGFLASEYSLDERSDDPTALAAGRYDEVPFDTVLMHAQRNGVRDPDDIEYVRRGHDEWAALQSNVFEKVRKAQDRLLQYFPPKCLFAVIRVALMKHRYTLDCQGQAAVRDALEILWRQQWRAIGKLRDHTKPELAMNDTMISEWKTLREIREGWNDRSTGAVEAMDLLGDTLSSPATSNDANDKDSHAS